MSNPKTIIINILLALLTLGSFALAGTLLPVSAPGNSMKTLADIYCKYTDCVATQYTTDSPAAPASTMNTLSEIYNVIDTSQYGRGWVASTSGANATTSLSQATCEATADWKWFEDGNGDGDTLDPEDGLCVLTVAVTGTLLSWNGYDYTTNRDNTYIAGYACEGSFPTGHVQAGTYNGLTSAGTADTTWNSGDCALCEADCFDGRRDLPAQGAYTANPGGTGGYGGPLTPEILKKWKGTRLPTFNDFYGFCGYKDGGSNYETACSATVSHGDYGQMLGRTDECLDLSNSATYEWLSEQVSHGNARVAGSNACSYSDYGVVYGGYRFRAVFRP